LTTTEGFGVYVGGDGEEVAFARFGFIAGWGEVVVEGAFGGFVEFLRIAGFVGGCVFVFWWVSF
jgi:hypothetical protein